MRALSLFSGCGGFCEGVKAAGFDIASAVELDPFASETYRQNFPTVPLFEGDIRSFFGPGKGERRFDDEVGKVNLVFGGPPCQGYSQIGPRNLNDERNTLYEEFGRVLKISNADAFIMENVPNMILMNKGYFKQQVLEYFAEIGFKRVSYVKVSAADYGVPQTRTRVLFFGLRDDVKCEFDPIERFKALLAAERVGLHVTVAEAIGDLPAKIVESGELMPYRLKRVPSKFAEHMRLDCDTDVYSQQSKQLSLPSGVKLYNHHTKDIQERRRELIALLKPGMKGNSLPTQIWNGKRPEKWRRLHPDKPSHTILAQMHRDMSEWIHPSLQRWITVREAARLQSFHDGFVFYGSEWRQLKQVGNAVPPMLARAAAMAAKSVLIEALPSASHTQAA